VGQCCGVRASEGGGHHQGVQERKLNTSLVLEWKLVYKTWVKHNVPAVGRSSQEPGEEERVRVFAATRCGYLGARVATILKAH
jgi:hypothetical protein